LTHDELHAHACMIPCLRRRLARSTLRHFTLRRACCSFEVYEIDCASPLTGSATRRRDEFLHLLFAPFSPVYVCVCARVLYVSPLSPLPFFNFLIKSDLALLSRVRGSIPENESLILRRGGFDGSSDLM